MDLLPNIDIKFKIWFERETDGEVVSIGEKKIELLNMVYQTGSIKIAAEKIGMDYKKAWDMINNMNESLEEGDLVLLKRGRGGGATITDLGFSFLNIYEDMNKKVGSLIDSCKK